jgi:DNA repair exonuclease SbcCD ATPase subunit
MTKIVELRANGFARLTAVTIRPDGALVQITGKNQQGKTSVLTSIWTALKGRAAAPAKPINKNAEEARIYLDLGIMVITRTFKKDKHGEVTSDLKVVMADGSRAGAKPQAMIDALLGDLSFNPLEFAKLAPKDQFDRVKALVPGFDFNENQAQRDLAFDKRTDANRDAKAARARAQGIILPPGPKPKLVSIEFAAARLQAGNNANIQRDREDRDRSEIADKIESLLDDVDKLRKMADAKQAEAGALSDQLAAKPPLPARVDVDALAAEINSADQVRRAVAAHEQRAVHEQEATEAERLSTTLTALITICDEEKSAAIAAAKMPVDGLSFGDGEVLLNGLPFSQAGTAEKIRASVGIGMALNPDLRVMLLDEASELDSTSLAMVAELAETNNFQVWATRVEESGKVGFVICNGTNAE